MLTDAQKKQYEASGKIKLTDENVQEILNYMQKYMHLTEYIKDVMFTFVTGKGKWEDYSKSYLIKEFSLKPEIKKYKRLAAKFRQELETEILEEKRKAELKAKAEKFARYKKEAESIIKVNDVEALARIILERDEYKSDFYKDYR